MKRHIGPIIMMAAALAVALVFYVVSLKVAAERRDVTALRGAIERDLADIAALNAELRTRARLPELERWNRQVLAMQAPAAGQLLTDPVHLARYAPNAPAAVPTPAPAPVMVAGAPVMVAAAVTPPPPRAAAPAPGAVLAAAAPAPRPARAPVPVPMPALVDAAPGAAADLGQAIAQELEQAERQADLRRVALR